MPPPYKFLGYEVKESVAWITLNRPPLNVMNTEMLIELADAFRAADADPSVSVIVVTGAGRAFSAGADVADHLPEKVGPFIRAFNQVFYTMWEVDKPIVAAVNGHALGGGCELVLACDMAVASTDAQIGQPEVAVGVYPPVAIPIMPLLVGRMRAFELILTGARISGEEAARIGLVNRAVPPGELMNAVNDLVARLKDKSPIVLRLTKRALKRAIGLAALKEALEEVTRIYLDELMKTEDAVEGLRAFLEKRKPVWRGK
ncbi:MAG: enoyl-CoA hydratase/isomerase family protein [Candidatus Nezhaarchaeales archaeon]